MNILIKTERSNKFLRTEAVAKAIEYEETHMKDRNVGIYNCVVFSKFSQNGRYDFIIYHTEKTIVVSIKTHILV